MKLEEKEGSRSKVELREEGSRFKNCVKREREK
jgi:hypothetical protein